MFTIFNRNNLNNWRIRKEASINRDKETIDIKYDFGNDINSNYYLDSTKINNFIILKDTILEVIGHKLLYKKLHRWYDFSD